MKLFSISGKRLETFRKDMSRGRKVILTRESGHQLIISRWVNRETGDEYFESYVFNVTLKTKTPTLTHLSFEGLAKRLDGLGFIKYETTK